jgi:hypothetical protein
MGAQDINHKTVGGTLIFSDYLIEKGYGSPSQVEPWKTALKKVFGAVDGDEYESVDWSAVDLDEYFERFTRLTGATYKTESRVAYQRRVRNAIDAHLQFIETGRAPAPRARQRAAKESPKAPVVPINEKQQQQVSGSSQPDMVTFPYPLDDGRMVSIVVPPRLKPSDVNRITAFIRTLQDDSPERKQISPPQDGQQAA